MAHVVSPRWVSSFAPTEPFWCLWMARLGGTKRRANRSIWAVFSSPRLVVFFLGIILPSYIGIIISHYKDPYQPTSIMECQQGFERCSYEFWIILMVFQNVMVFQCSYQTERWRSISRWRFLHNDQYHRGGFQFFNFHSDLGKMNLNPFWPTNIFRPKGVEHMGVSKI